VVPAAITNVSPALAPATAAAVPALQSPPSGTHGAPRPTTPSALRASSLLGTLDRYQSGSRFGGPPLPPAAASPLIRPLPLRDEPRLEPVEPPSPAVVPTPSKSTSLLLSSSAPDFPPMHVPAVPVAAPLPLAMPTVAPWPGRLRAPPPLSPPRVRDRRLIWWWRAGVVMPTAPLPPTLPDGWLAAKDAAGRTYYYHTITMATRWDMPVAAPPPPPPLPPSSAPPAAEPTAVAAPVPRFRDEVRPSSVGGDEDDDNDDSGCVPVCVCVLA
jgi:hypothetical protein